MRHYSKILASHRDHDFKASDRNIITGLIHTDILIYYEKDGLAREEDCQLDRTFPINVITVASRAFTFIVYFPFRRSWVILDVPR